MIFTRHSIPNLLRALAKAAGRLGRSRFANSEDPVLTTPAVKAVRQLCCIKCTHYEVSSAQCRLCSCVVVLKVMLASERCPTGFWVEETARFDGLRHSGIAQSKK